MRPKARVETDQMKCYWTERKDIPDRGNNRCEVLRLEMFSVFGKWNEGVVPKLRGGGEEAAVMKTKTWQALKHEVLGNQIMHFLLLLLLLLLCLLDLGTL